ncbi:MAG: DUF5050 domain-containing protein [Clostridiales bacterium]|nr:DUF5050 domain-containing protein [Clostridiales bacterium]
MLRKVFLVLAAGCLLCGCGGNEEEEKGGETGEVIETGEAVDFEEEREEIYITAVFEDGGKTYLTLDNGKLYYYDGENIELYVDSGEESLYCFDGGFVYCACKTQDNGKNLTIRKIGGGSDEVIYETEFEDKGLWGLYAGEGKVIYSATSHYMDIYNYRINGYSIYSMNTDGSDVKSIVNLNGEIRESELAPLMISKGYVYYVNAVSSVRHIDEDDSSTWEPAEDNGSLWKVDFEGESNEYITSDTSLSSHEDFMNVYMYNDKIYYCLAARDENGEFLEKYYEDARRYGPYYNLYRADTDNQNVELVYEDIFNFSMTDGLFAGEDNNIYDEDGNILFENAAEAFRMSGRAMAGRAGGYLYCNNYYDSDCIYKYDIESGEAVDIYDAIYRGR